MKERILGVDFGLKRIGLAISNETGSFALPHGVIANNKMVVDAVRNVCKEKEIKTIVVGHTSSENDVEVAISKFNEALIAQGFTVKRESEHGTSHEAVRFQGYNKESVDASAAALILQRYLDRNIVQ